MAHGKIAPGCLPNHSVVATGHDAERQQRVLLAQAGDDDALGLGSIVVEPYLCSIVTGKAPVVGAAPCGGGAPAESSESSEPQAASDERPRAEQGEEELRDA